MENRNGMNAQSRTQATRGDTLQRRRPRNSRRRRLLDTETQTMSSDRHQLAAVMNLEGDADSLSLQTIVDSLSQDQMRHLFTLIAERTPSMLREILVEQHMFNVENTQRPVQIPPPWCVCRCCRDMPTSIERVCCGNGPNHCLSHISDMNVVVLHQTVLAVADTYRRAIFGIPVDADENRRCRHSAYRQFTVWRYGRLGSRVRRVIPSCCVWRIRERYPDALGQYTGFVPHRRNVFD
ncbi:P2X purinoceptor 7-like isoform X3 [Protopterus annectens]|uniref:P2X purinoceptor 7-like isoform X3 n=1 Tax=Protopterus annectens TaxID=7888 RepID=UPI001CFA5352|nr:P2X purinoceptor 7-like isoform X3 [Protopterus annectens]